LDQWTGSALGMLGRNLGKQWDTELISAVHALNFNGVNPNRERGKLNAQGCKDRLGHFSAIEKKKIDSPRRGNWDRSVLVGVMSQGKGDWGEDPTSPKRKLSRRRNRIKKKTKSSAS